MIDFVAFHVFALLLVWNCCCEYICVLIMNLQTGFLSEPFFDESSKIPALRV